MKNTLDHCRQWLINDQHEYGEFGRHEIINPTDLPRTYELSLIKPNVFSSIVAYTTLLATGNVPSSTNDSFHKWIEGIRSDNGYWTSASGKTMPFSGRAGWSSNINLRHTAKGLDYNLLSGNFGYQDALIFNDIITSQLSDGSFPQFKGMDADLWSTAYYINLLIRATMEENLRSTLPRGYKILDWKNQLKNKLDRAINWLLEQLDKDYLWKISGTDSYVITLAMMVEVGGYLAIFKPEICASIIRNLLVSGQKSPTFVYVACLALDTLLAHEQGEIRKLYNELIQVDDITPLDLLEVVSLCKLRFLNSNLDMLLFYRNNSNGHETQLKSINGWQYSDYFTWMLENAYAGQMRHNSNPVQEGEFWQFTLDAIQKVKHAIEYERGWQLLWHDDKPLSEENVQVYLNMLFAGICNENQVSFGRELETGRGPVDFVFRNGFVGTCILEVKLSNNAALENGNFLAQVYEYARGLGASSVFLLVVDFWDRMDTIKHHVDNQINSFRTQCTDMFIKAVYIDATKKRSASKMKITDIL